MSDELQGDSMSVVCLSNTVCARPVGTVNSLCLERFNLTRCRFEIKPTKLTVFCTSGIIWAELLVPEVAVVAVDVVVLDVQPPPVAVQGHFCLNWRGKE